MRYLIDTNILIRLRTDNALITKDIFYIIKNPENLIYVSSISVHEVFVLLQGGRLNVSKWENPKDVFNTIEKDLSFTINYVKKEHLLTFANLEPVKGHNDPFDRMIIAQAITEKMPLISSDRKMQYYKNQKLDFIFNEK
ncbi:MAG: type II toxin-antitoxin system VapC family toxin [Prevotellaceae bacterium]|jgi:PIN domain nuclease of toxin-antitoxin system|nr:type II toxin-antitoxin system VapC family toxin [Prevotellaceae bacterium]